MEFLMALFKGLVLLGTVAYLFYDSLIAMVFLSPFLFVYLRIESRNTKKKSGAVADGV